MKCRKRAKWQKVDEKHEKMDEKRLRGLITGSSQELKLRKGQGWGEKE